MTPMLRLSLGLTSLTVSLLFAAHAVGPIAGVVAIDGERIELLDLHWLFATHGVATGGAQPPLCLIDGADSTWMNAFLKPLLEGAGYRVATKLKAGESAAVVLTTNEEAAQPKDGAPVVRLRRQRNAGNKREASVYRYDRDGLLAALATAAGGR